MSAKWIVHNQFYSTFISPINILLTINNISIFSNIEYTVHVHDSKKIQDVVYFRHLFCFPPKKWNRFPICAKFLDKLGCYWKHKTHNMYKLPDFLSFSNLFSNFNLQIGLVHLLQRLMIKTLKRKIQFSNDKDMKRVFLLPSVINVQTHQRIKINKIVTYNEGLVIFWLADGRGGGGEAIFNIPEQRNKVIFSLLEEEAKI